MGYMTAVKQKICPSCFNSFVSAYLVYMLQIEKSDESNGQSFQPEDLFVVSTF